MGDRCNKKDETSRIGAKGEKRVKMEKKLITRHELRVTDV